MVAKKPKKRAHRTNYKEWLSKENLTLIEGWARQGLTNTQIAHNIGISEQTLYNWYNKHPKIRDAAKKGKEVIDYEVESALYRSAIGYWVEEEFENETTGEIEKVKVEYIKPDTRAAIFWLKNRVPDKWFDRKQVEHSGRLDSNVNVLSNLSEKEIRALAEMEIEESDDNGD